jgi:hypothetical protein
MKLTSLPLKNSEKSAPEPSKNASEVETSPPGGLSAPPRYLSKRMRALWTSIFATRKLEPHEAAILLEACLSFDRAEGARKVLEGTGLTFTDRFGQPRCRPEIAIERDNRIVFAKLIKQLNLYPPEGGLLDWAEASFSSIL